MKILFTSALLLLISVQGIAQLRVVSSGNVGVGTNNPWWKFHVNGTIGVTGNNNRLHLTAGNPGVEIGSTTDNIDFIHPSTGHNILNAQNFNKVSDSTVKTNINELNLGLEKVLKINTYSYDIKSGPKGKEINNTEFGFLSQEIGEIFPNIVTNSHGLLLMDYDQIIPLNVKAIQEQNVLINKQQLEIDSLYLINLTLESKLNELELRIRGLEGNTTSINSAEMSDAVLHQNSPNPFKEKTVIKYDVSKLNFRSASIVVFNMSGVLIKSFPIDKNSTELIIDNSILVPGMFIYSLVVDNKEIDSKKMLLLE